MAIIFAALSVFMVRLPCPRCGGFSWIIIEDRVPVQKCVCGLHRYLELSDGEIKSKRNPANVSNAPLPARGSTLSKVLGCLVSQGELSSVSVAKILNVSVGTASTNLSVLRSRGLVQVVRERKGKLGGSVWATFDDVKKRYLGGL